MKNTPLLLASAAFLLAHGNLTADTNSAAQKYCTTTQKDSTADTKPTAIDTLCAENTNLGQEIQKLTENLKNSDQIQITNPKIEDQNIEKVGTLPSQAIAHATALTILTKRKSITQQILPISAQLTPTNSFPLGILKSEIIAFQENFEHFSKQIDEMILIERQNRKLKQDAPTEKLKGLQQKAIDEAFKLALAEFTEMQIFLRKNTQKVEEQMTELQKIVTDLQKKQPLHYSTRLVLLKIQIRKLIATWDTLKSETLAKTKITEDGQLLKTKEQTLSRTADIAKQLADIIASIPKMQNEIKETLLTMPTKAETLKILKQRALILTTKKDGKTLTLFGFGEPNARFYVSESALNNIATVATHLTEQNKQKVLEPKKSQK